MKIVTAVDVKKKKTKFAVGARMWKGYAEIVYQANSRESRDVRVLALKLAVRQQARQSLLSMKRDDTEARLARGGGGFSVAICHVPTRVLVAT